MMKMLITSDFLKRAVCEYCQQSENRILYIDEANGDLVCDDCASKIEIEQEETYEQIAKARNA